MKTRDVGMLLDIPIDKKALSTVVNDSLTAIDERKQITFVCANPHSMVVAQKDPFFKTAIRNASLVVADGIGVTLMAKLVNVDLGPRITGTDYFLSLMEALDVRGNGRVFFLGSSQEVLNKISERLKRDYPGLTLTGMISPPFRPCSSEENKRIIEAINSSSPDVLWVGMTAPKQEKWVEENKAKLNVPIIGSIGAVFDFYAGTYPRAPEWMCKIGIEWVYRLFKEPRRM